MDYEIREFEQKLVAALNEGRFPLEVKRLILLDILANVSRACDGVISKQLKELNNGQDISAETELG